ncbi:MAG TPA: carboxylesterase family protein [Deltaproteobacteria bacterium]|nr:carboxylesterase family protein [Deltaproteobacteria bacterium]HOI05612.1 carboxylesterase family protein [Deltaproteobacteria bacterium]
MFRKNRSFAAFLLGLLVIGSAVAAPWGKIFASTPSDPLVRETLYGAVQGIQDEYCTWSWRGIPYAKPPVGSLRWRAPQPPDRWGGVLGCGSFRSICAQYGNYLTETGFETMGGYVGKGVRVGSEDCLYLNVWRPRTTRADLPVYIFIHGGANIFGRSDLSIYNGARFASQSNMVFVTLNYRLGYLGWFYHPALCTGDRLDDSGNYGLLDIIQALRWVQDNIASFGGDPGNVTVCGQSAGAFNIHTLLVSPLAEGLFHRAVLMSGAPAGISMAEAQKISELTIYRLLKQDGYAKDTTGAKALIAAKGNAWLRDYLKSKSIDDLYSPQNGGPLGMLLDRMQRGASISTSSIDGCVIPRNPLACLKDGDYHHVPIMLGNTSEELKLFIPFLMTDPSALWLALDEFDPDHPDFDIGDVLNPLLWPLLPLYDTMASAGQLVFQSYGVDCVARILAKHQKDVYAYKFAWDEEPKPFDFLLGAGHALDIAFVFGNFCPEPSSCTHIAWGEANKKGREKLSSAMMRYHAQFARTGDPNARRSGLPEWKPWDSARGKPKRMVFDTGGPYMSSQYVEPVELPCPQCTLSDVMGMITSSVR